MGTEDGGIGGEDDRELKILVTGNKGMLGKGLIVNTTNTINPINLLNSLNSLITS